jgi:pSer/pThr/pTyr-binding forkhead associated (FHA) protein
MAYVVVTIDGNEVARRAITDSLTLGRSTECDIAVIDRKVSRQHCRIECEGNAWRVVDLNSHNGTYVHGQRMDKAYLHDGDSFEIGHAKVTFHEVGWVPGRPAEPGQKIPPSMFDSTITGAQSLAAQQERHTKARLATIAKPSDKVKSPHHSRDSTKPLPFTRPPARPIVDPTQARPSGSADEEVESEPGRSLLRRWLKR